MLSGQHWSAAGFGELGTRGASPSPAPPGRSISIIDGVAEPGAASSLRGHPQLVVKLAMHRDQVKLLAGKDDEKAAYHQGQVELLTPLVKAYGSDEAFRLCALAIQVFGGAGFLKD